MKRKVGILGGSFNPPHNAHILLGNSAFKYLNLQSLIYMPTHIPSHKTIKDGWSGPIRSLMIKLAVFHITPAEALNSIKLLTVSKEKIGTFFSLYEDLYHRFHRDEISVSDLEIKSDHVSYTIDTVKNLLGSNPDWVLFIIIGMDQAKILDSWKDYLELSSLARFCAADREGIKTEEIKKRFPFIEFFPFPKIDISSSLIRKNINSGRKITGLVPPIIEEFIELMK